MALATTITAGTRMAVKTSLGATPWIHPQITRRKPVTSQSALQRLGTLLMRQRHWQQRWPLTSTANALLSFMVPQQPPQTHVLHWRRSKLARAKSCMADVTARD